MSRKIHLPAPELQADFAYALKHFHATYLQDALFATVRNMKITEIDKQLAQYVSEKDLALLARYGLRGELLFPVPAILEHNPYLLGYYRLLLGYSQKEFYGNDRGYGAGPFKHMETSGKINSHIADAIPELCSAFCQAASLLLQDIEALEPSKSLLRDLALLTVGPQLRGGANNRRGMTGIRTVFAIIRRIVLHSTKSVTEHSIEIVNATGRRVLIEFAPDPDIIIREEMSPGYFRSIVAMEIKSGMDVSNIHNRIGEAEKSHQKARQRGFTECWTIVNAPRLDILKAKSESPSTDRFYRLEALRKGDGEEYEDFHRRLLSLTSITATV
jgi:hypothetical protein